MAHCRKRCLSILLTDNCNLSCKYCYCKGNQGTLGKINFDFIKEAINDFYKIEKKIFVRFFGNGEPTLEIETIKKTVEYCRTLDEKSKFELQTNGCFNKELCEWVGNNIDIVWISYDGTTEINDFYRPSKGEKSVSKIVEENIKYLSGKVKILGVRVTIGRHNIDKQFEIIDKMRELNVKYIYSDLLFASVSEKAYLEEPIEPLDYAKKYLVAREYAEKYDIAYGSFYTINFDEKTNIFCRACIPMPHLTVDGYVSCCDMGYNGKDMKELIYGRYDQESKKIIYDQERINYIKNRTVDNIEECKECPVKYNCAGGCIGEALNENGTIYSIKDKNCDAIRYLASELLDKQKKIIALHP